jgi:hypothetical protein
MEENSTDRPNVHQTNSLEVGRLETPGSFGGNLQSFLRYAGLNPSISAPGCLFM